MAGEIGPATGEMGTVNLATRNSTLAERILLPLTPLLKANNYRGFFNVNCIVDGRGKAWPLEITPRPGWPCFQLQLSIARGDFLESLHQDRAPKFRTGVVTTGVVLAHGDFPHSHLTRKEVIGIPVFGFDDSNAHFHPCEMMKDRSGQWVTAGDYVCVVTGHGQTVTESKTFAYQNLKSLTLPNSPMYRKDIGEKVESFLPKLHKHGLAKSYRW
jgi:phosphoribosylamine--glycine ligase